jgi:imidazole glycerol-phosphate synthase subunit HisH
MHVIVDYNVGNLTSVQEGFKRVGIETIISKDMDVISKATSLILPGVGAFEASMRALKQSGLIESIQAHIRSNKLVLGICLGMQILYEYSEEFGLHKGLEVIPGGIKKIPSDVKIPHMGWNTLTFKTDDPIFKFMHETEDVYFVHSYYAENLENAIATTHYGVEIPAVVRKGNVYATQFHPEKSGDAGLRLLKGYGSLL